MQKTYEIPAEKVQTLIEVFGESYQDFLPNGDPNPLTKAQYAEQTFDDEIINYVKKRVSSYMKRQYELSLSGTSILNTI